MWKAWKAICKYFAELWEQLRYQWHGLPEDVAALQLVTALLQPSYN